MVPINISEEKINRLPKIGAIVKTEDGEGVVDNVEILKEQLKVKFRDGDEFFYKKYNAKDVKIIKNGTSSNKYSPEEAEHMKELKELEKLEKIDNKNKTEDEI